MLHGRERGIFGSWEVILVCRKRKKRFAAEREFLTSLVKDLK